MRILIVEDSEDKARRVQECLIAAVGVSPENVEHARSMIGALRKLGTQFDLLVLDLVLPIQDGEDPAADGGKRILSEIVNGNECCRPSHIICLTAHEDAAPGIKESIDKSLVHLVFYETTTETWRSALTAKALYVAKRIEDANSQRVGYGRDIAIVTSSPLCELNAVKQLPGGLMAEFNQRDSLNYFTGEWKSIHGHTLTVVACSAPRMGMTAACVTACKVIERWRPKFLVMTGIAAATKGDLDFGDVLVADATYDYGCGKIATDSSGVRTFIPSPHQIPINPDLFPHLQLWEQEQTGMDDIRRAWQPTHQKVPRMRVGIIASGAAVVQDGALVEGILSQSRKTVGIDMEAYGIFHAAQLASSPRPQVLVAKSVSDFGDKTKGDDWQPYAAFTSARFIYEFFTKCKLPDFG